MVKGELPHRIKAWHERYGPIVRVAPDELSFLDATAWRDIYPKNFIRPNEYKDQPPGKTAANLIACTESEHARFRKILAPGFSEKNVMEQEPFVRAYVNKLIAKLNKRSSQEEVASSTTAVDMVEWINYVAFDIIGDLTWGSSFGCLDGLTYHPWIQTVSQFKTAVLVGATKFYPMVYSLLMAITPPSALKEVMEMWKITEHKVRQRVGDGNTDRPDLVSTMLATSVAAQTNPDQMAIAPMTREEMEVNAMMIVAAGSESITTVLCGAINYLLRNPEKLTKLVHEIRSTFPSEREIEGSALKRLSYLNAVLTESMRLCPTIPDAMRRLVPPGGAMVTGQILPAGTVVSVPPWASYRSSRNFAHPDDFVPERWLVGAEREKTVDRDFSGDNQSAFNPFSLGPHNCPGQNLAWLEMRLIFARLLWSFDLSVPPAVNLPVWESQRIWWFWDKKPLLIQLARAR